MGGRFEGGPVVLMKAAGRLKKGVLSLCLSDRLIIGILGTDAGSVALDAGVVGDGYTAAKGAVGLYGPQAVMQSAVPLSLCTNCFLDSKRV